MQRIFISYRREDSAGHAGRISDRLKNRFGAERVFLDIETIRPGSNFVQTIDTNLDTAAGAIVVIGRDWLTFCHPDGRRRLDDPEDFVRIEVAAALERQIPTIPVLVEGARMPGRQEMPPSLEKLAEQQALELSDTRWDYDTGQLLNVLAPLLGEPVATTPAESKSGLAGMVLRVAAALLGGLVLTILMGYLLFLPSDQPPEAVYAIIFLACSGGIYLGLSLLLRRRKPV